MAKHEEENLTSTLRSMKDRDPFCPFRIVMSSGESFTIEHPNLLVLNESQIVYYFPRSSRAVYLRTAQIVTIDDVGEVLHAH